MTTQSNSTDSRYSIMMISEDEIRAAGAKDIKSAKHSNIVFANLTVQQAEFLRQKGGEVVSLSHVKSNATGVITPPPPVTAVPTFTPEEFLSAAGLEALRNVTDPPLFGSGINIAVLGTGMRETHEQLKGRVIYSKNFTTSPDADVFDHDTGVASIIVSLAPQCGLLNFKVIDDNGEGSEEAVVMAIEECIDLHENLSPFAPNVINMSLGEVDDGNINNPLRVACRTAIHIGIWVFAAAGNSGPNHGTIMSPACEQYVFATGSARYIPATKSFVVSQVSSRGPTLQGLTKPDVVLFGEDMIIASSQSDTAITNKTGTSFTCPFAAGMGVIYLEGIARRAKTLVDLGQLPPAQFFFVPAEEVIDTQLPRICLRAAGMVGLKDNDYGYGLPFGPLISQNLATPTSVNLAGFGAILPIMMIIPMLGGIMKSMMSQKAG